MKMEGNASAIVDRQPKPDELQLRHVSEPRLSTQDGQGAPAPYARQARYLKLMAQTQSSHEVAAMLSALALHYDRLARRAAQR